MARINRDMHSRAESAWNATKPCIPWRRLPIDQRRLLVASFAEGVAKRSTISKGIKRQCPPRPEKEGEGF